MPDRVRIPGILGHWTSAIVRSTRLESVRGLRMKFSCVRVTVFFGDDSTLQVEAGNSAAKVNSAGRRYFINPNERQPVPIVLEALAKLEAALKAPKVGGIEMANSGRFLLPTPEPVTSVASVARVNLNSAMPAASTPSPASAPRSPSGS